MTRLIAMATLALALAPALGGCGSTDFEPTQRDLQFSWESKNVPVSDYKGDILAFMRTYLNDPTQIRNAAVSAPVRKQVPGDPGERFIACVRYTAKKSSGTYGGAKIGLAVFASGKLDHFVDTPRTVEDVCKDAAYAPFPELQKLTR